VILLHIFRKDTREIPKHEIQVARTVGQTSRSVWTHGGGVLRPFRLVN